MANVFKLKRRTSDATAPTTGNLVDGEIAVNAFSKTIYQRIGGSVVAIANYFSGAWSDLSGKPTTIGAAGITDVYTKSQIDDGLYARVDGTYLSNRSLADANSADTSGFQANHLASGAANQPSTAYDHFLVTWSYNASYSAQIGSDIRGNEHYFRVQDNGTWTAWGRIWHSGNSARTIVSSSDPGAVGAGVVWIKPA